MSITGTAPPVCSARQCLTHLPCLLLLLKDTHHKETRQRMKASQDVWPAAGGPSLETQFMQFYTKDNVTVLKVSLNIVKDLCQIDLTPIRNFKYCFTIENKWFKSLQTQIYHVILLHFYLLFSESCKKFVFLWVQFH